MTRAIFLRRHLSACPLLLLRKSQFMWSKVRFFFFLVFFFHLHLVPAMMQKVKKNEKRRELSCVLCMTQYKRMGRRLLFSTCNFCLLCLSSIECSAGDAVRLVRLPRQIWVMKSNIFIASISIGCWPVCGAHCKCNDKITKMMGLFFFFFFFIHFYYFSATFYNII